MSSGTEATAGPGGASLMARWAGRESTVASAGSSLAA